jgi:hypothetical protein
MDTSPNQGRSTAIISCLAVGFVIALFIGQSLNPKVGPPEEAHGIVQGSAFALADGPPSKNVWVLLPNGTTVVIKVPTNLVVKPGQEVKLHVFRRLLTNAKSYAIVSAEVTQ